MTFSLSVTLCRLGALAAAGAGLALTPIAAHAQAQTTAAENVTYGNAMVCSAVFTLISTSSAGEAEEEELINLAAQWLLVAAARNSAGGVPTETQLQEVVGQLIEALDAMANDTMREETLYDMIDECEAIQESIPEEFLN